MTECRDWLATLFPASYKGVPFWVEKDEEGGGRRLVVHQFPMRDDPFVEDLGEDERTYDVTAYVASDAADREAASVLGVCTARGAGTLVLPMQGPVTVQCKSGKRSREKDRHGYVALELKFIRDGAASAVVTVASLAQAVFDAAGSVSAAAGAALAATVATRALPDVVANAATDAAQLAVLDLEGVRAGTPVDPAASGKVRDALSGLLDAATLAFARRPGDAEGFIASPAGQAAGTLSDAPETVSGWGAGLVEAARALGDGIASTLALPAFANLVGPPAGPPANAVTETRRRVAENEVAIARTARLAALAAMAEAAVRRDYGSRQEAIAARATLAELFWREQAAMTGAALAPLYLAVETLRGLAVAQLSRRIIDLAPILDVEARISMPSLWWAWRLHADPKRATELVARNGVVAPALMPLRFEALAERAAAGR